MAVRSSDSRLTVISGGAPYGSKTSAYSSRPSKSTASRSRSASRSGSGPASLSNRSSGTKSSNAPSRPPASSSWLTSSSRYGSEARPSSTPSSSGCAAMSRTEIRKLCTWSAICSANSSRSSLSVASARSAMSTGLSVDSVIDRSSPFKRPSECDLVGVLEITAYWKSTSQSGDAQPHGPQQPAQVGRCRLTLEIRVGGQDDLGHLTAGEPLHQFPDPQLVRSDPLDRRDRTAEDVVAAAELAGPLDRHDVLGLLDHADQCEVATRVAADPALRLLRDVAADLTEFDLLLHLHEHVREPAYVGLVGGEQVERDALCGLRTDAGQAAAEAGQAAAESAGQRAHRLGRDLLRVLRGVADRGDDQVRQRLGVVGVDRLRLDRQAQQVT